MTATGLRRSDDEVLGAAVEAELEGIELVIREDYPGDRFWNPDWRRRFAVQAVESGLQIASAILSTVGRLDFPPEPERRKLGLEMTDATLRACGEMGIPIFMVPCFKQHSYTTVAQIERAVVDLRRLAPLAEDLGVVIALETLLPAPANHWILDAIGSSAVRLYYDAANSLRYGWDPLTEIPDLGSFICQHHVKAADRPTLPEDAQIPAGRAPNPPMRLDQGTMDQRAVLAAIRRTGYDGWLILETGPIRDDPVGDARFNVRKLREWLLEVAATT